MTNRSKITEVEIEPIVTQTKTTEEQILALFTGKNVSWPVYKMSQATGIPRQTVDSAVRRMVLAGVLSVKKGMVIEGRRIPVMLYSKN